MSTIRPLDDLPVDNLLVALVPMTSHGDPEGNWQICIEKIHKSLSQGARWLILPEMFLTMGEALRHKSAARYFLQTVLPEMQELCLQYDAVIFAGTVPHFAKAATSLPYNRLHVVGSQGGVIGFYDKMNLFRLRSGLGKNTHDETRIFSAGTAPTVLSIDGWQVGLAICYDLRFPSHFLKMLSLGPAMDVIVIPSAFTDRTGEAHWQLLLRSLAVTMQAYVLACNQVGEHGNGKKSYGHSMVVDPWGEIIVDSAQGLESVHAILAKARIETVRQQLPSVYDLILTSKS